MNRKSFILPLLTIALFGCSSNDRVKTINTYSNGQTKKSIYKTIDADNTYYEIDYDSLGRIKNITPFSNGLKNGTQIYFKDNLFIGAAIPYKNNERDGFVYEFREDQQIAFKGKRVKDKFEGESTWYFENGQVQETGKRIKDQKQGEWKEYYESGSLKAKGTYQNGVEQKDWKNYNQDRTENPN